MLIKSATDEKKVDHMKRNYKYEKSADLRIFLNYINYVEMFSITIGMCGVAYMYGRKVGDFKRYIASVYIATGICGAAAITTNSNLSLTRSFGTWNTRERNAYAEIFSIKWHHK